MTIFSRLLSISENTVLHCDISSTNKVDCVWALKWLVFYINICSFCEAFLMLTDIEVTLKEMNFNWKPGLSFLIVVCWLLLFIYYLSVLSRPQKFDLAATEASLAKKKNLIESSFIQPSASFKTLPGCSHNPNFEHKTSIPEKWTSQQIHFNCWVSTVWVSTKRWWKQCQNWRQASTWNYKSVSRAKPHSNDCLKFDISSFLQKAAFKRHLWPTTNFIFKQTFCHKVKNHHIIIIWCKICTINWPIGRIH